MVVRNYVLKLVLPLLDSKIIDYNLASLKSYYRANDRYFPTLKEIQQNIEGDKEYFDKLREEYR